MKNEMPSASVFEATIDNASQLRRIFEAIKELVKEINLQINETGMSLQAMDGSHIALVSANLKQEGFSSFKCVKPITIGINLEHFLKVMHLLDDNAGITLCADESGSKLYILSESKSIFLSKTKY